MTIKLPLQRYEIYSNYFGVVGEFDNPASENDGGDWVATTKVAELEAAYAALEAERDALRAENESIKQLTPWLIKVKLRDMGDSERVAFIAEIMSPFCMSCGSELMGRKCHCENDE